MKRWIGKPRAGVRGMPWVLWVLHLRTSGCVLIRTSFPEVCANG